ncbi:CLUMA_CG019665, isoform A [Clunio marinus]|uniref:CLUMA_CG019665, isoform A n=1 Tax=Clunio marinus TaxID=568069 RepID=A0A1J1J4A8_9DIPT|nr:CLUMA_CG019665, isoform A [Clunio marinus]
MESLVKENELCQQHICLGARVGVSRSLVKFMWNALIFPFAQFSFLEIQHLKSLETEIEKDPKCSTLMFLDMIDGNGNCESPPFASFIIATHFTVQPSNPDVHKITNTMKAMTTTLDGIIKFVSREMSFLISGGIFFQIFDCNPANLSSSKEKLCKPISLKAADEILHICAFWRNEIRRKVFISNFLRQALSFETSEILLSCDPFYCPTIKS